MKRTFPNFPGEPQLRLKQQRRANGTFKVKNIEKHLALYLGVSPRAIRLMQPTGRTAEPDDTLDDLRSRWTCQIVLEHYGRGSR